MAKPSPSLPPPLLNWCNRPSNLTIKPFAQSCIPRVASFRPNLIRKGREQEQCQINILISD